ncbi:hypothetical protein [Roseisolibacter agri]|uniref:Uncharacterized protein n=1 Tax=Roseisolibacter agri TaxID=2014610 RepID=A0AA37Q3A7_9BACT|nr:hypothetical protein [Roseisolibacter agri]GLC25804.1 hypothetical protein rosag_23170 [Roseisolibacter agri]
MAAYDDRYPDDRDRPEPIPPYQSGPGYDPRTGAPLATAPAVVHRRRRGGAFWAALAVLLLVIGWGLTRLGRNAEPEVAAMDPVNTPTTTTTAGGEVVGDAGVGGRTDGVAVSAAHPDSVGAGAVRQLVTWANQGGNQALPQESEANHPYTAQGLRLLADALGAASSGRGGEHAAAVARVRRQADLLQASPDDDQHAEYAHAAFMDAARVIGDLRGGEARAELTAAASRVQAGRALSPQGEQVRAYFRLAAAALQGAPATR